jgi:hypothetical protein
MPSHLLRQSLEVVAAKLCSPIVHKRIGTLSFTREEGQFTPPRAGATEELDWYAAFTRDNLRRTILEIKKRLPSDYEGDPLNPSDEALLFAVLEDESRGENEFVDRLIFARIDNAEVEASSRVKGYAVPVCAMATFGAKVKEMYCDAEGVPEGVLPPWLLKDDSAPFAAASTAAALPLPAPALPATAAQPSTSFAQVLARLRAVPGLAKVPVAWVPRMSQAIVLPQEVLATHTSLAAVSDIPRTLLALRQDCGVLCATAESIKSLLLRYLDILGSQVDKGIVSGAIKGTTAGGAGAGAAAAGAGFGPVGSGRAAGAVA